MARIDAHIDGEVGPGGADAVIGALADAQHGVVARRQLLAAGIGRGAIDRRVERRRLRVLHRGVYAVGHARLPSLGRWMGAVLACGPGALLSHVSGAALLHLLPFAGAAIHVTAKRGRERRPGIVVHTARRLDPADRAVHDGVPVTSVSRTLLDLAETVPAARLEQAVEQAERLGTLDMRALAELEQRAAGRRGLRALRALLDDLRPAPDTRSGLERRFLAVVRDAALPAPATNATVAGHAVDAVWPEARLVVELDGHAFHLTRAAFEQDRVRDADLQLAGYRVLRITSRRLRDEPAAVARTVQSLLSAAASAG